MKALKVWQGIKTLLCAAVGTASHQHGLEACSMCGRCGIVLKNKKFGTELACNRIVKVFIYLMYMHMCVHTWNLLNNTVLTVAEGLYFSLSLCRAVPNTTHKESTDALVYK
jgi:hypothetical protein